MKGAKLLIALVLTIACATTAKAQLSIQLDYAAPSWTDAGDALNGGRVALGYDINLVPSERLSLRPGVSYTYGVNSEKHFSTTESLRKVSMTEHTVGVPVHLKFAFLASDRVKAYIFAGPALSAGISLKTKYTFDGDPKEVRGGFSGYVERDLFSGKITSDLDNPTVVDSYKNGLDFARFDLVASTGIGVQYGRMFLEFTYDFGLLNRLRNHDGTIRRNQLSAGIGYCF